MVDLSDLLIICEQRRQMPEKCLFSGVNASAQRAPTVFGLAPLRLELGGPLRAVCITDDSAGPSCDILPWTITNSWVSDCPGIAGPAHGNPIRGCLQALIRPIHRHMDHRHLLFR